MIRIRQIKMPITHTKQDLINKICKKLNIKKENIKKIIINKKSIDARKEINYIYEVDIETNQEKEILKRKIKDTLKTPNENYKFTITGKKILKEKPVIIGAGPAGLFCAYFLAKNGYNPIIIERGEEVDKRVKTVEKFWKENILNTNSNIQFGEGGAGTFSDGKLNTTSKDIRIKEILKIFVKNGAPKEILYIKNPHIGTDILRIVIKNIRNEIIKYGGKFIFNTTLEDIQIIDNKISKIKINDKIINTETLILAIGHSSRDTFKMLLKKSINMKAKPFAVGIRVQHKQELIDKNQYGKEYKNLPKASYKLTYKSPEGRGVYSFCMCPGGFVVNSSSEKGKLVINGMSNYKRDEENANSAIIVTVSEKDFGNKPLDGIKFQEKLEQITYKEGNGNIPVQLYKDFKNNKISKNFGTIKPVIKGKYQFANINNIFPKYITNALIQGIEHFDKKIKGFAQDDTIIAAIESRTSSPVKIFRDENLESNIKGIYPCGEGAGYAGGIMTSAIDGIKVAESIAKKYKPF